MVRYTIQERVEIIRTFYQQGSSVRNVWQHWLQHHHGRNPPAKSSISALVAKFEKDGTVLNVHKERSGRPRTVVTPEIAADVHLILMDEPSTSTPL